MGYEYKIDIGGVTYGMSDMQSAHIEQPLFEKLSVGNACMASFTITLWPISEIPKMAQLIPYCRETGGEWRQLGVFYIDTRKETGDALTITAYDAMGKADADWIPAQSLTFPMTMEKAAQVIAELMSVSLDPRCAFNSSYEADYPPTGTKLRDVLRYIAGAHAGNWIITNEGKLLLVPLFGSMPEETFYLVTEEGSAITLGGTRIIV